MGHTLCLQPWTNISGVANQTILQHDTEWADLAGFQDAGVYFEISQFTTQVGGATTSLLLQTAPIRNEAMFTSTAGAAASYAFSGTPTVGLQAVKLVRSPALHRFLRWSLVIGTAATSVHFRIWLNLNPTGW